MKKKKYLETSKETKAPRGRARNMDDSHSFYFVLFDDDGDARWIRQREPKQSGTASERKKEWMVCSGSP